MPTVQLCSFNPHMYPPPYVPAGSRPCRAGEGQNSENGPSSKHSNYTLELSPGLPAAGPPSFPATLQNTHTHYATLPSYSGLFTHAPSPGVLCYLSCPSSASPSNIALQRSKSRSACPSTLTFLGLA